jgi:uncharacterized protein YbjT (DUF2867 family)
VRHHVALSIVGCDRVPEGGYLRAKVAQEKLIRSSSIPYSIVRSTQFFEFIKRIADEATDGNRVRFIRLALDARHDSREVVGDPHARYFGAELGERSLVPEGNAVLGGIRFEDWLGLAGVATAPTTHP